MWAILSRPARAGKYPPAGRILSYIICAWLALVGLWALGGVQPVLPLGHRPGLRIQDAANDTIVPLAGSLDGIEKIFHALHKPTISPDAPTFRDFGGQEWDLGGKPQWTERLGERLCIINLDSREMDEDGQVFNEGALNWDTGQGLATGTLNHFLYASIHGYKYYYIRTGNPPDRRASWRKPPVIAELLKQHDICIYMDSDAIFNHLHLPFEWLLNYWRFQPGKTSMALALDPNGPKNKDKTELKRVNANTGFIISQNLPRTYEILNAWETCPDEGSKYVNCTRFLRAPSGQVTDQGAFSTYIRYDYKDDIIELPCTEANGFPESHSGCNGDFVRHFWTGKHFKLKGGVGESLAGALLEWAHKDFLASKSGFFLDEKDIPKRLA